MLAWHGGSAGRGHPDGASRQEGAGELSIRLDHTIVPAHDRNLSARFLCDILGLPEPRVLGPFTVAQVGETSLDFMDAEGEIDPRHYAFLVNEADFDAIYQRIREQKLQHWADPYRREEGRINTWDGGRGVYWSDPSGHLLEIITRPYGTGGSTTDEPHPLVAS